MFSTHISARMYALPQAHICTTSPHMYALTYAHLHTPTHEHTVPENGRGSVERCLSCLLRAPQRYTQSLFSPSLSQSLSRARARALSISLALSQSLGLDHSLPLSSLGPRPHPHLRLRCASLARALSLPFFLFPSLLARRCLSFSLCLSCLLLKA